MSTSPRPATQLARTGRRGLALVCAGVLSLGATGTVAPASASASATSWDPGLAAVLWLPAPSVDGDISVLDAHVRQSSDFKYLRAFRVDGTEAYRDGVYTSGEAVWAPAGDAITGDITSAEDGGFVHDIHLHWTRSATQWSPFGDSAVRAAGSLGMDVQWAGGASESHPSMHVLDGPVFPNGRGMVVGFGTSPERDLGILDLTFPRTASLAADAALAEPRPLGYGSLDARQPAMSAGGTLAFVGGSGAETALYVDEGEGARKVADLGASCPGARPSFAPSGTALAYLKPIGTTCVATELRVLRETGGTLVGGADTLVTSSEAEHQFTSVSWRAVTPSASAERLAGSNRVATGIRISEWGWPSEGSAPVVVLASADAFPDAIVGGPLAAQVGGPLLLTPGPSLKPEVLTEIRRVLDPEGAVLVVGGPGAVSVEVETALEQAGIATRRIGGSDRYRTSVLVAQTLDEIWADSGHPRPAAFLANGRDFPDALVSGPAATTFLAPVLLTNGITTPGVVRQYVAGQPSVTKIYAVGGGAARAGTATFGTKSVGVHGRDRYETAQQVAMRFFAGASVLGYASGVQFPDALTGGTLMANMGQPLMLTSGTELPWVISSQASAYRPSTDHVLVFGGAGVVSDTELKAAASGAGTQTAIYGWDVAAVDNPRFDQGAASQSDAPGNSAKPMRGSLAEIPHGTFRR